MPGTVKVKVIGARNLPVMDRATYLTDAFVELKLGNTTYKTDVIRRSLNPSWNTDWYRFELDDQELQEEALQIRVLDHDTYSAHDAIGRVYFDLNPLLGKDQTRSINGWFPIYDTMHGIRGEINLAVRVEIFSDASRFRQSSVGVRFFYSTSIPQGYRLQSVMGFVEELVMNDDPEYQWIEKIRTSRASNEARQRLFSKLNGELQRKLGVKVIEMGGNSVIGYQLHFDLEGETGIVVRGIGTAALLMKFSQPTTPPPSPHQSRDVQLVNDSEPDSPVSSSPVNNSEETTKALPKMFKFPINPVIAKAMDYVNYPFLTISQPPVGFIQHFGSIVSAKSVKLLDKNFNPDEPETRDAWWLELRTEVRSHMRSLGCTSVLAYREESAIHEDVIVLSAYGTAVTLNPSFEHVQTGGQNLTTMPSSSPQPPVLTASLDRVAFERERTRASITSIPPSQQLNVDTDTNLSNPAAPISANQDSGSSGRNQGYNCALCHVPYNQSCVPFSIGLVQCDVCKKGCVPDLIFSTSDIPEDLAIAGQPALIQARVFRPKREYKGESCAKEISDSLPFIEYDLHRRLMQKLKLRGMNGLFGLRIRISIGEYVTVALGTGTGVYIVALPPPQVPRITKKGGTFDECEAERIQGDLLEHLQNNRERYELPKPAEVEDESAVHGNEVSPPGGQDDDEDGVIGSVSDGSDPDVTAMGTVAKETIFVESDDVDFEELLPLIRDPLPPKGLTLTTTEQIRLPPSQPNSGVGSVTPVCLRPLQSFVRVCRVGLGDELTGSDQLLLLMKDFNRSTWFKFRNRLPCALTALDYRLSITDENDVLILATGMCLGTSPSSGAGVVLSAGRRCSLGVDWVPETAQCPLDFDPTEHSGEPVAASSSSQGARYMRSGSRQSSRGIAVTNGAINPQGSQGCLLTPLAYIPGMQVDSYLGNLDFFFVRETTSIREFGCLSGFVHACLSEVQAVVGAHTLSLGGNALLSYHLSEIQMIDSASRNQAQCLLNVCGDMVRVTSVTTLNEALLTSSAGLMQQTIAEH